MSCTYYLSSREFVFWSLLHSAEYIWHWCSKAVSGDNWHLFQCFLLCWAWILHQFSQLQTLKGRQKHLLSLMCKVTPADLKVDIPQCHLLLPQVRDQTNQTYSYLCCSLYPTAIRGVSPCSCQESVHQRETLRDSQHCWWDATIILPLCRPMFCCDP